MDDCLWNVWYNRKNASVYEWDFTAQEIFTPTHHWTYKMDEIDPDEAKINRRHYMLGWGITSDSQIRAQAAYDRKKYSPAVHEAQYPD